MFRFSQQPVSRPGQRLTEVQRGQGHHVKKCWNVAFNEVTVFQHTFHHSITKNGYLVPMDHSAQGVKTVRGGKHGPDCVPCGEQSVERGRWFGSNLTELARGAGYGTE